MAQRRHHVHGRPRLCLGRNGSPVASNAQLPNCLVFGKRCEQPVQAVPGSSSTRGTNACRVRDAAQDADASALALVSIHQELAGGCDRDLPHQLGGAACRFQRREAPAPRVLDGTQQGLHLVVAAAAVNDAGRPSSCSERP